MGTLLRRQKLYWTLLSSTPATGVEEEAPIHCTTLYQCTTTLPPYTHYIAPLLLQVWRRRQEHPYTAHIAPAGGSALREGEDYYRYVHYNAINIVKHMEGEGEYQGCYH